MLVKRRKWLHLPLVCERDILEWTGHGEDLFEDGHHAFIVEFTSTSVTFSSKKNLDVCKQIWKQNMICSLQGWN